GHDRLEPVKAHGTGVRAAGRGEAERLRDETLGTRGVVRLQARAGERLAGLESERRLAQPPRAIVGRLEGAQGLGARVCEEEPDPEIDVDAQRQSRALARLGLPPRALQRGRRFRAVAAARLEARRQTQPLRALLAIRGLAEPAVDAAQVGLGLV